MKRLIFVFALAASIQAQTVVNILQFRGNRSPRGTSIPAEQAVPLILAGQFGPYVHATPKVRETVIKDGLVCCRRPPDDCRPFPAGAEVFVPFIWWFPDRLAR